MKMSDERLAEIEARAASATPGPWFGVRLDVPKVGEITSTVKQADTLKTVASTVMSPQRYADAAFIAHSRQDVGDLLAEVRRLRRALALSEASRGTPSVVGQD